MIDVFVEPSDRRRRRTRAAVLNAAAKLFEADGYRATSVDSLAEAADVALSSIYANFPGGKADVYAVLAHRTAVAHAEQMAAAIATAGRDGRRIERVVFDEYRRYHRDNPMAFRLLGLTDVDDASGEVVATARTEIRDILRGVLDQAVAASALSPDVARTEALLLWASINGVLALAAQRFIDAEQVDGLLDALRERVDPELR